MGQVISAPLTANATALQRIAIRKTVPLPKPILLPKPKQPLKVNPKLMRRKTPMTSAFFRRDTPPARALATATQCWKTKSVSVSATKASPARIVRSNVQFPSVGSNILQFSRLRINSGSVWRRGFNTWERYWKIKIGRKMEFQKISTERLCWRIREPAMCTLTFSMTLRKPKDTGKSIISCGICAPRVIMSNLCRRDVKIKWRKIFHLKRLLKKVQRKPIENKRPLLPAKIKRPKRINPAKNWPNVYPQRTKKPTRRGISSTIDPFIEAELTIEQATTSVSSGRRKFPGRLLGCNRVIH